MSQKRRRELLQLQKLSIKSSQFCKNIVNLNGNDFEISFIFKFEERLHDDKFIHSFIMTNDELLSVKEELVPSKKNSGYVEQVIKNICKVFDNINSKDKGSKCTQP